MLQDGQYRWTIQIKLRVQRTGAILAKPDVVQAM